MCLRSKFITVLVLAGLHNNENLVAGVVVTKDGVERYQVWYPK